MINYFAKRSFACLLLLFCAATAFAFQQPTRTDKAKRLIILNSYNEGAPWSQQLITPILAEAARREDVVCAVQHINATYITNDSLYERMTDAIFQRHNTWMPNMVVCIGNSAFTMRDRIKEEWGDVPIVVLSETDSVCLDNSYYYTGQPSESYGSRTLIPMEQLRKDYNFTHVNLPCFLTETVDMMVRMVPNMKRLVFAADELYNNQHYEYLIKNHLNNKYPNLIYERAVASYEGEEQLKDYLLSETGKEAAVLFSTWFYKAKTLYGFSTLISGDYRLITYSPRPVFCLRNAYLTENGFLGGCFYAPDEGEDSVLAAVSAMMDGKDIRLIPFSSTTTCNHYVDYAQILEDEVNETDCFEDTIFVNRPPSFWDEYKWYAMLLIVIVMLVMAGFFFALRQQQSRNKLLANHSRLLRNMPVFYTMGRVKMDENGSAKSISYTEGNYASQQLFSNNAIEKGKNSLFELEYILQYAETVLRKNCVVNFTHYFKNTESFYEFAVCPSSEKNCIDIFGMDTTARHKAEEQLRESNQKLELTLGIAKLIPWTWNLKNNIITCEEQRIINALRFRKRLEKIDYTKIDAKEYLKHVHPDDQPRLQQIYRSILCGEIDHVCTEYRIVSQVGEHTRTNWVEVNALVEKQAGDVRPISIRGSLLLITERKRQEQRLINARNKAAESDKLKSAFLANMSHEIRTPLNAIIGFSNLLATTDSEEERSEYVSIINNNNQLLLQIISDILDLAKIESNTFDIHEEPTDINDLMHNVERTIQSRVKPNVKLVYSQGEPQCVVMTDRNRVSQVMINFLNNAAKFTLTGTIEFGYKLHPEEGDIYFFVKDSGEGIAQEDILRIFDRFYKVDSFSQGTGLGLPISKAIIQQMNGRIGVESEGKGQGSLFWFALPAPPLTPPAGGSTAQAFRKPQASPPSGGVREGASVLIAEDNPDNFSLLKTILGTKYNIIHAWNGEECIEMFKKNKPNIILMDINMPKVDGYKATETIRTLDQKVPIIAVTAYAYGSDRERILTHGFNGYVSKPINAAELHQAIEAVIE